MQAGKVQAKRVAAWVVLAIFVAGVFWSPVGVWTGPVLGAWFVGTQRLRRGFVWMTIFAVVPGLMHMGRTMAGHGVLHWTETAGWIVIASALSVLPFTAYRVALSRGTEFLITLTLPLNAVLVPWIAGGWVPRGIAQMYFLRPDVHGHFSLFPAAAVTGVWVTPFLRLWLATVLVWMWNLEFRPSRVLRGGAIFAAVVATTFGLGLWRRATDASAPEILATGGVLLLLCSAAAVLLDVALLLRSHKPRTISAEAMELLRSPVTGERLRLEGDHSSVSLVSRRGERFPIRDGMPVFLRPEDLTGANRKYNQLYQTIGGFYDDSQRVAAALSGFDRDAYVWSYLSKLEVKDGDRVLETSVGTGLNFKYLPQKIQRYGLDLSAEMLANCQANFRRWKMDGELLLGNAESLSFADASFDVVFHVGGINFFSDRAKAIREMIRVAKPGSLLLIADETEEHVKAAFERIPIASGYYQNRAEAVSAPVDFLPPDVEDVRLEILNVIGKNRFYALTFRKGIGTAEHDGQYGGERGNEATTANGLCSTRGVVAF